MSVSVWATVWLPMRSSETRVALGMLLAAALGCGGPGFQRFVRDQFATETRCTLDVTVWDLDGHLLRAEGCGARAEYACIRGRRFGTSGARTEIECVRRSLEGQAEGLLTSPRESTSPSETTAAGSGRACQSHDDCPASEFCNPTRHVCVLR